MVDKGYDDVIDFFNSRIVSLTDRLNDPDMNNLHVRAYFEGVRVAYVNAKRMVLRYSEEKA